MQIFANCWKTWVSFGLLGSLAFFPDWWYYPIDWDAFELDYSNHVIFSLWIDNFQIPNAFSFGRIIETRWLCSTMFKKIIISENEKSVHKNHIVFADKLLPNSTAEENEKEENEIEQNSEKERIFYRRAIASEANDIKLLMRIENQLCVWCFAEMSAADYINDMHIFGYTDWFVFVRVSMLYTSECSYGTSTHTTLTHLQILFSFSSHPQSLCVFIFPTTHHVTIVWKKQQQRVTIRIEM